MKISTAQFFRSNSEAMSKGQFEVSSLQAKLGSGKQITTPSDDPKRANLVSRLESALKRQSVYQKNIDVAKTRIMTQKAGEAVKYTGLVSTIATVAKEEGIKALFKGTIPRVMYLAPLAGISFAVYEAVAKQIMKRKSSTAQKKARLSLLPTRAGRKVAICANTQLV